MSNNQPTSAADEEFGLIVEQAGVRPDLVLGFFFWEHFERLASISTESEINFRDAEQRLGDVVGHEQIGQLLLMRAAMNEDLVRCVGAHH